LFWFWILHCFPFWWYYSISNTDTIFPVEPGYSIFVKNLPFSSNIEIVEEEFKRFGTIKPGGVQLRHNKVGTFSFWSNHDV
jgi:RNA recognition motif-containing protein